MSDLRFYGFGNYYLASIQQGIQSAHAMGDMFVKYADKPVGNDMLFDWAKNHKTMVLLNGGNSQSLRELLEFFDLMEESGMTFPYSCFNEDQQSLDGALTAVGIVLPSSVYDLMSAYRKGEMTEAEVQDFFGFEESYKADLVVRLAGYNLAS